MNYRSEREEDPRDQGGIPEVQEAWNALASEHDWPEGLVMKVRTVPTEGTAGRRVRRVTLAVELPVSFGDEGRSLLLKRLNAMKTGEDAELDLTLLTAPPNPELTRRVAELEAQLMEMGAELTELRRTYGQA